MQAVATKTETPEGFSDEEFRRFEKFQAAKEAKRTAAAREKAGLTTAPSLRRNEMGNPTRPSLGCTAEAFHYDKDVRCDGSSLGCRQKQNPVLVPGELVLIPAGHTKSIFSNPAFPEVDPASVPDEPTVEDRLLLEELRSLEQRAQTPATAATYSLANLEGQRRVLAERIEQAQEELDRRRTHVEAAKAKTEEFLGTRSEEWRKALLAGAPGIALRAAAQRGRDDNADFGAGAVVGEDGKVKVIPAKRGAEGLSARVIREELSAAEEAAANGAE